MRFPNDYKERWESEEFEVDCPHCDEGVFQWTHRDEITICDHCSYEISVDSICQRRLELMEVD